MVDNVHLIDIWSKTLVFCISSAETLENEHRLVDLTTIIHTTTRQTRSYEQMTPIHHSDLFRCNSREEAISRARKHFLSQRLTRSVPRVSWDNVWSWLVQWYFAINSPVLYFVSPGQMDSFFQRSTLPSDSGKKEMGGTNGTGMAGSRPNQSAPITMGSFSFSLSVAPQPKKEKIVGRANVL